MASPGRHHQQEMKSMSEAKASDKTQSLDTRVAHQQLLDGLDSIKESLDGASLERKIEIGSILWAMGDSVKEVIDLVKTDVREAAVQEMGGQVGSTTLEGDDWGEATVIIPSAQLVIPKGRDIDDLKRVLATKFSFFFEETITHKPHKEFEERVASMDDALTQKILLDAVERNELTPRVKFRRHKPSNRDGGGDK
jgi:hypothetical protein